MNQHPNQHFLFAQNNTNNPSNETNPFNLQHMPQPPPPPNNNNNHHNNNLSYFPSVVVPNNPVTSSSPSAANHHKRSFPTQMTDPASPTSPIMNMLGMTPSSASFQQQLHNQQQYPQQQQAAVDSHQKKKFKANHHYDHSSGGGRSPWLLDHDASLQQPFDPTASEGLCQQNPFPFSFDQTSALIFQNSEDEDVTIEDFLNGDDEGDDFLLSSQLLLDTTATPLAPTTTTSAQPSILSYLHSSSSSSSSSQVNNNNNNNYRVVPNPTNMTIPITPTTTTKVPTSTSIMNNLNPHHMNYPNNNNNNNQMNYHNINHSNIHSNQNSSQNSSQSVYTTTTTSPTRNYADCSTSLTPTPTSSSSSSTTTTTTTTTIPTTNHYTTQNNMTNNNNNNVNKRNSSNSSTSSSNDSIPVIDPLSLDISDYDNVEHVKQQALIQLNRWLEVPSNCENVPFSYKWKGFICSNAKSEILFMSNRLRSELGLSADEIPNLSFPPLFHPSSFQKSLDFHLKNMLFHTEIAGLRDVGLIRKGYQPEDPNSILNSKIAYTQYVFHRETNGLITDISRFYFD